MIFSTTFILASLFATTSIAAPTPASPVVGAVMKRELPGNVLPDVATFGGVPGNATLADLSQNECGITVKPGDLVFLVSRAFLKAAPGTSAAENGLCGRLDATIFVLDDNDVVITENSGALAPVGICDDCAQGDVVVNQATFDELGGDSKVGVINNVFPRFG
ncbi:hypothetical protein K435DRAFT_793491 [Dendrothele bispora CBS 962.96]|uniref:RlpA-like protein double-psi beta-barrel domain-containing protein n=1 Tax=Dendrothele bispora (strain CBS 962.96) TaxID=1314807 RepID=A0A4S8MF83_DENBC|nr:hypothetical protein K435DRAFT_793491 [Dendrothele bispora CBS 962.96]